MNQEKKIYILLEKTGILSSIKDKDYARLTAGYGLIDLSVDKLTENIIALSHNYVVNGDIVPDPDMQVEIDFKNKTARALSFQNAHIYQKVYNEKLQKELNDFLINWLSKIKASNYKVQE